jgi:arylsulfatase A-like enzyme
MFTGLWPRDHGANHKNLWLASEHQTLAEILAGSGYDTYAFSANPNITAMENFDQGFDKEEHLWDTVWRSAAEDDLKEHYQISSTGQPLDNQTGIATRLRAGKLLNQEIKGCGALLGRGLGAWLERDERDPERPWFGFLNYMEAHYPLQPANRFRERFMSEEDLRRSYSVDRSWPKIWSHVFGFSPLPAQTLASLDVTYDAAIAELDDLFEKLMADLEARGELENTVVILTSDHGENLGEHGLLDHRYSLSEELLRVPLVIWDGRAAAGVNPGRSSFPAMNIDLFSTILEVTGNGVEFDTDLVNLLGESADGGKGRMRLAEFANDFEIPESIRSSAPVGWSGRDFARRLTSVTRDQYKLVHSESAAEGTSLFDLEQDPSCSSDVSTGHRALLKELDAERETYEARERYSPDRRGGEGEEEQARLSAIGYGD